MLESSAEDSYSKDDVRPTAPKKHSKFFDPEVVLESNKDKMRKYLNEVKISIDGRIKDYIAVEKEYDRDLVRKIDIDMFLEFVGELETVIKIISVLNPNVDADMIISNIESLDHILILSGNQEQYNILMSIINEAKTSIDAISSQPL